MFFCYTVCYSPEELSWKKFGATSKPFFIFLLYVQKTKVQCTQTNAENIHNFAAFSFAAVDLASHEKEAEVTFSDIFIKSSRCSSSSSSYFY